MDANELRNFFERVYVVSLERTPEKLSAFQERMLACNWPFQKPQVFRAIDGKLVPHPPDWREGNGSFGCYLSHLSIIQTCLNENVKSVLILEDDAEPVDNFAERCRVFLEHVPKGWAMIYLGGQFLGVPKHPPLLINDQVVVPWNVNRTHGYALSRQGMKAVYLHLIHNDWWAPKRHIDHRLGMLHEKRNMPIYCPTEWLLWQAEGFSDICAKTVDRRDWQIKREKFKPHTGPLPWQKPPFYAIVGLHSSGSSAIAGVCYHLGMHLGDRLAGFYGNDPDKSCGFEARGLANLCEQLAPFPRPEIQARDNLHKQFRKWVEYSWQKARNKKTVAGGKYPLLCRMGGWLHDICGDGLRVIHCVRPIEDSIQSLANRKGTPKPTLQQAEDVQRWLEAGKASLFATTPSEHRLDVDFYELLKNPQAGVERIAQFMGIQPSAAQVAKAVAYVQPAKQHVGKESVAC